MTRRSEADAVGALCRALDGRDVGPLAARLDDASVLRVPGSSGLGGDYQGREAIVGLLRRMAAATDGTLRFEVQRTLAASARCPPHRGMALRHAGWPSGGTTVSVEADDRRPGVPEHHHRVRRPISMGCAVGTGTPVTVRPSILDPRSRTAR